MKKASVPQRAAAVIRRALERVGAASADCAGCSFVAMISGGSDSVALAYALADLRDAQQLPGRVVFVHVNHNLRGEASDGDAAFVCALAKHLGFDLREFSIDIPMLMEDGGNMEAVARAARYRAAAGVLSGADASPACNAGELSSCDVAGGLVLTAHTADDRVENFFMRAIVGTGPGGFRSMDYVSKVEGCTVCRPLLDVGREELRDFVRFHPNALIDPSASDFDMGALWREDATNADTDRFRAYVRHEMVPLAKARNLRLLDTLTRTMNLIAEEDDMVAAQAARLGARLVRSLDGAACAWEPGALCASSGVLIAPELAESPVPLQRRVLDSVLTALLPADDRVETASIEACLACLGESGRVANIQGNLAVSYNKRGLRVEPMAAFRARRNRG